MSLFTPTQIKAAIGGATAADDVSLQALLDAIEANLIVRFGPVAGPLTERRPGGSRIILLRRPAQSLISVSEFRGSTVSTALLTSDYLLRPSRMSLLRLPSGWIWDGDVEVVYTPDDDTAERKRIQLALMKLELGYSGLTSQTIDGYSESGAADLYSGEREDILNSYALPKVP